MSGQEQEARREQCEAMRTEPGGGYFGSGNGVQGGRAIASERPSRLWTFGWSQLIFCGGAEVGRTTTRNGDCARFRIHINAKRLPDKNAAN